MSPFQYYFYLRLTFILVAVLGQSQANPPLLSGCADFSKLRCLSMQRESAFFASRQFEDWLFSFHYDVCMDLASFILLILCHCSKICWKI